MAIPMLVGHTDARHHSKLVKYISRIPEIWERDILLTTIVRAKSIIVASLLLLCDRGLRLIVTPFQISWKGKRKKVVPLRYFIRSASSIDACMGKTIFSSSTEAYFNHAVITARRLVREGLKNEPMHGGGERANVYAARHSPPKWEGHLAI